MKSGLTNFLDSVLLRLELRIQKSRSQYLFDRAKAPFNYEEHRRFANRRCKPRGSKQQRSRGLRRRLAN